MSLKKCMEENILEVGIDEAGAGCFAGPVVIGAVIWPYDIDDEYNHMLNDSKKLSKKKRYMLKEYVEAHAIAHTVIFIDNNEIDKINILNARLNGFHKAIDNLDMIPDKILVDGDKFKPYKNIDHQCIKGGDGIYQSIAAASILAKCYRDDYMIEQSETYDKYGWETNVGYGTEKHIEAIKKYGLTPLHRKSFGICKNIELFGK